MLALALVPNQDYTPTTFLAMAKKSPLKSGILLEITLGDASEKKILFVFEKWMQEMQRRSVWHVGMSGIAENGTNVIGYEPPEYIDRHFSDTYYFPRYATPKDLHEYGVQNIKYIAPNFLQAFLPVEMAATIHELIRHYLYPF